MKNTIVIGIFALFALFVLYSSFQPVKRSSKTSSPVVSETPPVPSLSPTPASALIPTSTGSGALSPTPSLTQNPRFRVTGGEREDD